MKKLIVLVVLLLFCTNGFSQANKDKETRTYVVEYDFNTGLFPEGKKIRPRVDVPIVFKIKNINRLAYTISVKSKDSVIGFSDLSGLEKLLEKNEAAKIEADLKKAEAPTALQNNVLPVNSEDFKKSEAKTLSPLVNEINQANVTLLGELNAKVNELSSTAENKKMTIDKEVISKTLAKEFPYHFKAQIDLAELYLKIVEKRQTLISLGNDYLQIREMINNPLLEAKDISDKNSNLSKFYASCSDNKNSLSDFNLLINRFQNLYNAIKSNPEITEKTNYGGSLKFFSIVNNLNIEVLAIKGEVEAIKFDVLKQNIEQIHALLISNNNKNSLFEYVSDPIQPYQDVVVFDVKIQKKEKDASLFYNERDFSYKEFTRHGIRFDLNVGVAGSLFSGDNFYEIKTDASSVNKIILADKSGFIPSFVGFFTTSFRTASYWTGGLSLGLGISADQGTITMDNFFIGPSLIIGKYERVNLTAGVSFKNLPSLNSTYKVGDSVPNGYTIENVTTKSYQAGFFVALTYNLTKGVKNNVKQIKNFL